MNIWLLWNLLYTLIAKQVIYCRQKLSKVDFWFGAVNGRGNEIKGSLYPSLRYFNMGARAFRISFLKGKFFLNLLWTSTVQTSQKLNACCMWHAGSFACCVCKHVPKRSYTHHTCCVFVVLHHHNWYRLYCQLPTTSPTTTRVARQHSWHNFSGILSPAVLFALAISLRQCWTTLVEYSGQKSHQESYETLYQAAWLYER